MPDKNKMSVFKKTSMTVFKTCTLCKHGEIPSNTTWGYCKHPDHFYTHLRHNQRLPGVSHASMGCDDFEMMHEASRNMVELGPYLKLLPIQEKSAEKVGVETIEDGIDYEKLTELIKSAIHIENENQAIEFVEKAISLAEATWPELMVENAESKFELIAKLLSSDPKEAQAIADEYVSGTKKTDDEPVDKVFKGSPGIGKTETSVDVLDSPKTEGDDTTKTSFEKSSRKFKGIYDNTQVDDDEDTFDADFEEAGRSTDSAVAEAHADDADDE